ncbi:chloramphenicol acetyltransferase-like domain-containing protein [Tanacetum coccineum]
MDQIKAIIPEPYTYLVERNPNSWSRAFFDLNSKYASFENGIAESFNRAIIVQRTKPIITMLEDIRLYIMFWTVIPSGFQELEVRQGDQSFGVNLHLKKCMCKLWELSGIPCVHSVAAYLFLIRSRKNIVKAKSENNSKVSRAGKQITCSKCCEKGHNKRNCDKEQLPKPPQMKKQPGRKKKPNFNSYASNKGRGRASRGGRGQASGGMGDASGGRGHVSGGLGEASGALGEASGGIGQSNAARFQANTERGESSGGRGRARGRGGRSGRARGRGGRGQGRGGRGRGRGVTTMLVDEELLIINLQEINKEEIRKNMEHEYMEQILIEEEEKKIAAEKAIQEEFDEETIRLTLEEEARYEKEYQDKIREDEESEYNQMCYNHGITPLKSASTRGKIIEADAAEPPKLKKQGRKRKMAEPSAAEPPFRIYHKNRGRSERIFNQKIKKTGFGPNGERSTVDKAFSL